MNAPLALSILGSGSSGNCTAIVLGPDEPAPRVILVDAGLSPRSTRRRLGEVGLRFTDVTDILLTHLDSDHLHASWPAALFHNDRIHVHIHARHAAALRATGLNARRLCVIDDTSEELPLLPPPATWPREGEAAPRSPTFHDGTRVGSVGLPHDEAGATAYVLEHAGARIGFATDLGHVTARLLEAFVDLDALAFESNYDPHLQLASARPEFLKRRIMGGHGHLSNEEALEAIVEIDRRSRLQHVALLHLSRQCNDPGLVRSLWASKAPHLVGRLVLARQDVPTPMLRVAPTGQRSPDAGSCRFQ
ncbi:MAG: MBL fold metallo-hydrolase [Phycisphaerales bacterium]